VFFFVGNNNLKRLLTDYGFRGHPLKKNFPVLGFKELNYNEELKGLRYERVSLQQENRIFEHFNPWTTPENKIEPIVIGGIEDVFEFSRYTDLDEKPEGKK